MASKKMILGVVVVVIIVAVLAIAIGSGGGQDSSQPDARLNYEYEVADSFVAADGDLETAYAGNTFVILTITCANDHFSSGISTNDLIFQWEVTVDGMSYSTTVQGYSHPNYKLATIAEGNTGNWTLVFNVPAGTTHDDVTVSYEYVMIGSTPTFEIDETL